MNNENKTSLRSLLQSRESRRHATDEGSRVHDKMRRIVLDGDVRSGDADIISHIENRPELLAYFVKSAQTEVPIAGTVNGHFISRRIDRMIVDNQNHIIKIMDYKTDINRDMFHDKYIAQMHEYTALVRQIYPHYDVHCVILWLHDWSVESVS